MATGARLAPVPGDVVVPTIYFTGTEAPVAGLPHQRGEPNLVDTRLIDLFARNGVTDDYAFDLAADPLWVNAYASSDGNTYTVLAAVHRARHETVPIQGEYMRWYCR